MQKNTIDISILKLEIRNSYSWFDYLGIPSNIIIDPDGWDRGQLEESFKEQITLLEFINRIFRSSIEYNNSSIKDLEILRETLFEES